jgi:hypothetical protein
MKTEQQSWTCLAVHTIDAGIQDVLFAEMRTVEGVREFVRTVPAERPATGGVRGATLGAMVKA